MPNAAVAGGGSAPVAAPAGGGVIPFFYGTNIYVEKFASDTVTLDASQHELVHNINPGGFLRGYRIQVSSTTGALGGGALTGDSPWVVIASATLENIDGGPIIYPMNGYALYLRNKYMRPWLLNPALRNNFSNTANPAFSLMVQPEIRHTAGALANTDARAQYRSKVTVNTLTSLIAGGAPTAPVVTVNQVMESWAQPDATDLQGRPIEELPPGLNLATLARKQNLALNAAGADNTFQLSNMGNEIRGITLVTRNSSGVRTDLLSDPIRWRIDTRSLGVFSPQEIFDQMSDFYGEVIGLSARETGVYVLPRFYQPGKMLGQPWQSTTNATYNIIETATAAGGTNGTLEIYTDEVTPVGPVPLEFESI